MEQVAILRKIRPQCSGATFKNKILLPQIKQQDEQKQRCVCLYFLHLLSLIRLALIQIVIDIWNLKAERAFVPE